MASPVRKGRKTLESLVKDGKNDELKSIITQSDSSDLVDTFGNTLLHFAAKYNNIDIVNFLLNSNDHINARNSSGTTPLFMAAKHRNFDAVKILLNAGADVFITNTADQTILDVLMEEKESLSSVVIECFLQAIKRIGVDVKTTTDMFVNANCNLEIVLSLHDSRVTKAFLERTTTIQPVESRLAVRSAMKSMDLENVRVLLNCGPENELRKTLFFDNLVDLSMGPDMNLQLFESFVSVINSWDIIDKDRLDGFHRILISASEDAVRVLLKYEIDVMVKKKFGIDLIASVFRNRDVDVIELLKNRKFNVNAQGFRKLSVLHFALRSGSQRNVQFLIDLGADVNIKDEMGRTPLLDNHAWNGEPLGRILLQHGADVQAIDNAGHSVWNRTNFSHVVDFIIPQLSILETRGTPINPKNRVLLNAIKFVHVYGTCCYQCEGLRGLKLTDNMSLFDGLCEKTERIAAELRGEDFTNVARRYCSVENVITYYSETLEVKLRRAMVVYRAKFNLARIVSGFVGRDVGDDHLVVERIFGALTYRDLCSLV